MATNKNFEVKNGLSVSGTERISSAGAFSGSLASATTATTQSATDNSTKIATTAYTDAAITAVIGGAPGTLDTLNELAAAINDDASYASTLTTALATKLPLSGGTLTGHINGTSFGSGISATVGISGSVADLNSADLGPGYLTLARDDTAHAAQIRFAKNGSVHSYLETRSTGLGFVTDVGGFIFDGGNVGIGTSAPSTPLHVVKVGNPNGGNRNTVENVLTLEATGYYPYTGYGVGINFQGEDYGNTAIRDYGKIQAVMEGNSDQNASGDPSFTSQLGFFTNSGGASSTVSSEKMTIKASGKVGIGITSPAGALDVVSQGYGSWPFYVRRSANGAQLAGIYESSSGDGGHGMLYIMDGGGTTDVKLSTNGVSWMNGGNVGIGDTSPFSKLHVEDTGWSSGAPYGTVAYIQGGATNDANWGHLLISQSGTTTDTGGRLAFGANGENPIAGIRTKYKGATYGDLAFSTRPSGGINTERMVIDSAGTVSTSLGSNISTSLSGTVDQLIHWNPDEILVADPSTGSASYRDMHRFTAHKSGPLRVQWEAANQSGSYYWAARFLVDGVQMKKTNGDNAVHHFASSLVSGNSASVHNFRTFEMDLASVEPGQEIKYQMVSANGSGGPVDGNGQRNRLRTFGVYSSTPTNMGMPIIGYTQGGADVSHQNMTGLTIGSVGVDNKGGIALKTQFALQNEWNDICYVNNAGRTGVTFLLNATRDLDQNRQKTALVRYAYNQTFTEIAGGHQNTAWEYRYSDNRLQYRFTSAGNYLVQIMVMAGG